jgi:hypothetical protein
LKIVGESTLALDTPYTVMTFGANHLYGEFSQIETGGTLPSITVNNSTSVNLLNGDTLDVLYNEASGTIQVELVATPTRTTYDWDTGSGTWNALSAADWNPPGNKTVPSSNSSVTIGTGSGGTVTLAQDQTINSLSVTKGYTLSGATHSITTNGNVSVASGAAVSLHGMNVRGVFTDSGSVTLAGVLTINKGGRLTLSNGSITGGINGSGTFQTNVGTTGILKEVTIFGGTTFTASNNASTDISGTIGGRGTLQVNGGGGTKGTLDLTGATTLSGGGVVSLTTTTGGGSTKTLILNGTGGITTGRDPHAARGPRIRASAASGRPPVRRACLQKMSAFLKLSAPRIMRLSVERQRCDRGHGDDRQPRQSGAEQRRHDRRQQLGWHRCVRSDERRHSGCRRGVRREGRRH